jgi:hypothetical protein
MALLTYAIYLSLEIVIGKPKEEQKIRSYESNRGISRVQRTEDNTSV